MKVLIEFNHGLGDAVQLTCVFRHLRKYRPDWELHLLAKRGKHSVGLGHCAQVWHDQESPPDISNFGSYFNLTWGENYNSYTNCPSTKVTRCLREVFGIEPDPALLGYLIDITPESLRKTDDYLVSIGAKKLENGRYNAVCVHYEGNTSKDRKDIHHSVVELACELLLDLDYIPVILDWDQRSPLPDNRRIFNPGVHTDDLWGGFGSGDAERLVALISQCSMFIGIDSGPQKCAGATSTSAIGLWTKHLPVRHIDLCPNFTHLVPVDFHIMPACADPGVAAYFVNHYRYRTYPNDGLFDELAVLIQETLGKTRPLRAGLVRVKNFWVPQHRPQQSQIIIDDIYSRDAYKAYLRPRKTGVEYVVDLGANVGCFSKLWHERNPQAQIIAVEVCPDLLLALRANVGDFAQIVHAACHYDREPLYLLNSFSENGLSTGGSRVATLAEMNREFDPQYRKEYTPLTTITLEQLMERFAFPWIDVLKLDIEGSEFSVLENCDLSRVGTIFLESHGSARWRDLMDRKFRGWDIGHMSRGGEGDNFENWHLVNPNLPGG